MSGLKQSRAFATAPIDADRGWKPRLAQLSRLAELEQLLAARHDAIGLEVERAVLLSALNRLDHARQAFVAILRKAPRDFSALNEFGAFLNRTGAVSAACRVYAEAIAHHPDNPMGHINLANLLLRANRHAEARGHYETALRLAPDRAEAHQGLGAVLSDLGDRAAARQHFDRGFRGHAVAVLPYRGSEAPVSVLQLVSSGGGNIPTASFMDDRTFLVSVVVADYFDPSSPLPPHQIVFNTIGDADLCKPALKAAARLASRTRAAVVNDPARVMRTGRADIARRLRGIPGVVTPRMKLMPRGRLAGTDAAATIGREGFAFPLLLRSPGYHTGRNFIRVESAAGLAQAATGLPGRELLVIEYLDARGKDGQARKYRVMTIGGTIYPMHLAISRQWKVHYFTADMADRPDHRAEEGAFLTDMRSALGDRAVAALEGIRDRLGLDYGGIDFGLSADGNLLLFEANATMVIAPPDADERWAYRRPAISRIVNAARSLILQEPAPRFECSGGACFG